MTPIQDSPPSLGEMPGLLQDMAASTPEIVQIGQEEETNWLVLLQDGRSLLIEWQPLPCALILTAVLGTAPVPRQKAVYTTLLLFNLLWRDTGGLRMSLGGLDNEVVMTRERRFDDGKLDLQAELLNFADLVPLWAAYVTSKDEEEEAPGSLMPFDRA